ncbi:MAG: flagellar basal body-associated FliL family protein [Peptococcaceae bacterium]|nr:flagellar basal body-associated FliL family protein [Peptococcaceae bacterium]
MAVVKKDLVEKEAAEPAGGKKRSGIMIVLLVLAGTFLAVGLVSGLVLYFVGIPGVMPKMKADPPPVYETLELGERVVNLADDGGGRYLRVRMVLEHKKDEKLSAELKEKNAQIMDKTVRILRSKSVGEVQPVDKEEKLKTEIMNAINAGLKNGKIEKVYFTDFLIQ